VVQPVKTPREFQVRNDEKQIQISMQEIFPLAGSLLWSTFECTTTLDKGEVREPVLVKVYQNDKDKEIAGDIVNSGSSDVVRLFRSVTSQSKGWIPFCRAIHPAFGEVYPIAALPYGEGYLIVAGIEMDTSGFEKIIASISNFCARLQRTATID